MKLKETILKEHSKLQCDKIIKWVNGKQERFDELFVLFLSNENKIAQRAAWPISFCIIEHPTLISKHWRSFLDSLKTQDIHDAVKRNSVKILTSVSIPHEYEGEIMNLCFDYVASATESIAVKAYALSVLHQFAESYPEIIPEIKLLIEDQPHHSAAFTSRAKKFLRTFN